MWGHKNNNYYGTMTQEEVENLICNHICDGCKCKGINRLDNCKTLEKYMDCYRIGYENASNNE
jgi:hypothetical protein